MQFIRILFYVLPLITTTLCGCTAYKVFPYEARGGDTITLAVGSPDNMSRANTSATFISASDPENPVNLTPNIRSIFKLYADKASHVYDTPGLFTGEIVRTSGHMPWISIIAIDLPTALPLGQSKIEISTTATYPTIGSNINDLTANTQTLVDEGHIEPPIALNILPGTGAPMEFPYEFGLGWFYTGDLTWLEPQTNVQISPPFQTDNPSGWPTYGAVEIRLALDTDVALTDSLYRIIADEMSFYTKSQRSIVTGINDNELTVMFISPQGLLQYYEPRFAVVLDSGVHFSNVPYPASISSIKYYDINGNLASGPLSNQYSVSIN